MYFEEIDCCSTIIFSFFNLHELCKLKTTLWNKTIQKSVAFLLFQYKTNHILYKNILSKQYTAQQINDTHILFFTDHYLCQSIYYDFKSFLFGVFQTMTTSSSAPGPAPDHFYLATRQFRLFFVQLKDPQTLIIFIQMDNHSIFYTLMTKKNSQPHAPHPPHLSRDTTGYLIKNNEQVQDDAFILSLFYRNESNI